MHTYRTTYHATIYHNEEGPNRGTSVQLLYAMPFKMFEEV